MTPDELDQAAAALAVTDRPPPMPAVDALTELVWSVSGSLLDLWTLLESLEAEHRTAALGVLPVIAEHLDAAADRLQDVADIIGVRLPAESPLFAD